MGEVYLAVDTKLGRRVAIKFLNAKASQSESGLQRFTREAKAASSLNHPNIVVIHEIGDSQDGRYIVSEYVEGETLRDVMSRRRLSYGDVRDMAMQVGGALAAAHGAGIVHRDIKPDNIMVRPDGYVKVLDFGLAKLLPKVNVDLEDVTRMQNETTIGLILGTVSYMSPEQAAGKPLDERTDIFSLGVMIY